ncbi:cytochrome c oxidase, subunit IVB [Anoxybacillus sp. B7M1]|jgi:cytochrome c oxidase subunit IV|uniref:cytochrome c oxidase subunit IVB n=1 Tax=unclassified Anoxybacillus TaxID=2639704 RepID=UPI0005CCDB11|nr:MULTISPECIES: cytochrome c oxidase subunit IVB [unclassified Anoxybacillus]ANB59021.1 cytochrome c oxidase, subunit IVB [Anoxybacillus sp. B2M1]ANB65539.1 cytochrome c oxidase, subunit IVB [Anoxybacillus sp. B7M1]
MVNPTNTGNPKVDLAYRRKKNAAEMKHQVIAFVLMIALTLVAFFAVSYDEFSHWFSVPFILLLAAVQVAFQLYYFMHMSHKGHEIPAMFLYGGVLVAFVTIWAFMTIVWW